MALSNSLLLPPFLNGSNLVLRWCLGNQNTVVLDAYQQKEYLDFLWLAKLSIRSFQEHFHEAEFVLFFNGDNFSSFVELFETLSPALRKPIVYIHQEEWVKQHSNPYKFYPLGVWWKWVPFRYNVNKYEISIDTDIVCLNRPQTWYDWFLGNDPILVAHERFRSIRVNTCGDFWTHPILRNKQPLNCGVVGHHAGHDYSELFYNITDAVQFVTHNSLFITEQGAINVWAHSLAEQNIFHTRLDFAKNAWVRDFVYFLTKGICVETVHAVSWHKKILAKMKSIFETKVIDPSYSNEKFITDILKTTLSLNAVERHVFETQLHSKNEELEIYVR